VAVSAAVTRCPDCRESPLPDTAAYCPSCGHALHDHIRQAQRRKGSAFLDFLDASWDFFASVKVAAILIALIAVVSIAGTLVEQEGLYQDWRPPYLYYPARYGPTLGPLLMQLGLTHAYTSLWFSALIILCVISLVVCSLHRLIPLHRVLSSPQVYKAVSFIGRQEVTAEAGGTVEEMEATLRRRGYRVYRERDCLHADKGRLGRYGPYVIHIGLLVIAFAAYSKSFPGWDETKNVWLADGETAQVEGAGFALINHGFRMETYPSGMPSRFETDLAIDQNGQEVLRRSVLVNHPVRFDGWEVYQSSFRKELGQATLELHVRGVERPLTRLLVDLKQPEEQYRLTENLSVVLREYFHDFAVDERTGEPSNASYEIRNPVMLVEFVEQGRVVGRQALLIAGEEPSYGEGPFELRVAELKERWFTGLTIRRDRTVPFMAAGVGIMMIGMYITFFVFHRQIWVRAEGGRLLVGARTNKNKFGLRQEMRRITGQAEPTEEAT
jgi:cytochrome c biogenesis protein